MRKIVTLLASSLICLAAWAQTPENTSCLEEDKCPLEISLTRTLQSSNYAYTIEVYVDDYAFTTLALDPSQERLDTTLLFCPGRSVDIWTSNGGEDFAGTVTDPFGNVAENSGWGLSYYTMDVCAQQCELTLEIGSNVQLENIANPEWLEIYAGDDEYPLYTFYRSDCNWCGETVNIPVSAGVPLRIVWSEPDPTNHRSWFSLYDPSAQRMIVSKYSGDLLADGVIATYTPDCGAFCTDRCPLQITLTRTPYSTNYAYSAIVLVDSFQFATLYLRRSESRLDTTLLFCPERSVEIWAPEGGDDFSGTFTNPYGNVTENSNWESYSKGYYTRDVCAEQCELVLTIGADTQLDTIANPDWLTIYAGDDEYPFYAFSRADWYWGSETVTIPVSAGVPLRVVWHEPDADNHSSWFTLYDPSQQRMVATKGSYDNVADGEIATYTPDCGASCADDDKCPLAVSLTRTAYSNDNTYEVEVYVDDYPYATLALAPSQQQLDTTLLFCPGRRVEMWTSNGGEDFAGTVTDPYGNVTESSNWGVSYSTWDVCTEQCELVLEIGANYMPGNGVWSSWLELYAGEDTSPFYGFGNDGWWGGSETINIPVSAGVPLRVVWHEPDADNHSGWFTLYDPSQQRMVATKWSYDNVPDGEIATYTPDCGASCADDDKCPLAVSLTRTAYSNDNTYEVEVYVDDYPYATLALAPSQQQLDTTLLFCPGRRVEMWTSNGSEDFAGTVTDSHGAVSEVSNYFTYYNEDVCTDTIEEVIPDSIPIVYVTPSGSGIRTGESWENAMSSIAEAQELAEIHHAVVWVAAGIYFGDTLSTSAFTMRDGVNVYGGFEGNEPADYDLSQRDYESNTTILDGQNVRRVLYRPDDLNQAQTTWDGFTIQNGNGGVRLDKNCVLNKCVIRNNRGYGIYVASRSAIVLGDVVVSNCIITYNSSTAIRSVSGKTLVANCLVANNSEGLNGHFNVENTSILNNAGWGVDNGYNNVILNSIIWGNSIASIPSNLSNNIICSYSAIEGGYEGEGNISLDDVCNRPMFVNPSLTPGAADSTSNVDWHLQSGSVCINRGNNNAVTDSTDLAGNMRIQRDTVDMGCYESDYYGSSSNTLPVVSTFQVSDTTATSAVCGGTVNVGCGDSIIAFGVCWSTEPNPTINDQYTVDGTGVGSFTSTLSGLTGNTTYYVRAYATNAAGTSYGEEVVFTTLMDYQGIIYVTQTGAGNRSGNSWANATSSIEEAQALAQTYGAVVWVAAGTYYGDTTSTSENAFTMRDGVRVYGGFAGDEPADYDLSQRDFEANATILDGLNARRVLYQPSDFNMQTEWNGFTVQHGFINGNGGGVYMRGNFILSYCVVQNNKADIPTTNENIYGGGGVFANASYATSPKAKIVHCTVRNNIAIGERSSQGGGISAIHADIEYSQLSYNQAIVRCNNSNCYGEGGGLYLTSSYVSSCIVSNCLIANNTATSGGGIKCHTGTIINTTIVRNACSSVMAGAVGAGISGYFSLFNSIVWGNVKNNVNSSDNVDEFYSHVVENSAIECSSVATVGSRIGANCIILNASCFVNPAIIAGSNDTTSNVDWHLKNGSICVNRGNNSAVTDSLDLDGTTRIKRDTVDMGCYESDYNSVPSAEYRGIVYVTPTGAGTQSGESWTNAISSIKEAQVLARTLNAVVWVAAGTYYGDTTATAKNAFTMREGVNVYGGFAGNEPSNYDLSQRNFVNNETVLDGDSSRRVLYQPNEFDTETMWDGFTIQNGQIAGSGGGSYFQDGGGAYLRNNSTIRSCVFRNNNAIGDGGGLYLKGSERYGYNRDYIRIECCSIICNTSSNNGGGLYAYTSNGYNGGVSATEVVNCLVSNNTAGAEGGGIYGTGGLSNIRSSTIVRNSSGNNGGGVYGGTLTNCIVWGNERNGVADNLSGVSCTYSAVEGGYNGDSIIVLNDINRPLFVNPSLTAGATDITSNVDWHLQQGSPCINRGDNSAVTDSLDLDGTVRIKRDTVDLGCYESDYYSVPLIEYDSVIYVTETGAGTRTGESWTNATSSIEQALGLAQTYGAVVWVAAGTYYGDTTSTSENAFTMRDGVSVYGGFAGNEPADYDLSQRDFETNTTILDGQNMRRVLNQPYDFNNQTEWDGFTIQHGLRSGDGAGAYIRNKGRLSQCHVHDNTSTNGSGGGVYAANATIEECVLENNSATGSYRYGGGVYATSSRVSGCRIAGNSAYTGGGMYATRSSVTKSQLTGNTAAQTGGGIYAYINCTVTECDVKGNSAASGGGVYSDNTWEGRNTFVHCNVTHNSAGSGGGVYGNSVTVRNCLVGNNTATGSGGGIYCSGAIVNTTIVRNTSTGDGAGVNGGSSTRLQNCIVWGNQRNGTPNSINGSSASCSHSAVEGGYLGTEMVMLDEFSQPMFANPSLTAGANDSTPNVDWHLQNGSACVNRGDNSAVTDTLDLDGNARIQRDTVDMGCYESDYYSSPMTEYDSIIYVTVTGAGTHSGNSWANATSSIEEAQALAITHNAVVWVAAGTYYGDTTSSNAFTMRDGVNVYGGFAGNEPAGYDLSSRDFETNATILDGQNARRVLYQPFEFSRKTEWSGFTIRNGRTSGSGAGAYLLKNAVLSQCRIRNNTSTNGSGGGVCATNARMTDCYVVGNTCRNSGGGIYATSSSVVTGCRIDGNTTTYSYSNSYGGGGVYVSSSTVTDCQIVGNTSSGYGGGVYAYSNDNIFSCQIFNNTAGGGGGGVYSYSSYNKIVSCRISRNQSSYSGGGINMSSGTQVRNCLVDNNSVVSTSTSYVGGGISGSGTVVNTTIVRNSSAGDGAGVNGSSSTTLRNCIVWGNERNGTPKNLNGSSIVCNHSAIEGGYAGDDVVLLDGANPPLFVNPSLTAGASDSSANVDWHLQNGSVCINRGDNSFVTDSLDLDGTARVKRDTVDMGCYESDYFSAPITVYDSIIYVTVTGAGTRSGNSWANATSSIEEAQALAQTYNAVVWVAAGTYYGDTTATNAFTMRDGVNVYGGFSGNEPANYDLSLRDFGVNATILDGQNARRVLNQPFEFNNKTEWNGFTIRNGRTSGSGAGAYLQKNAVLSLSRIQNNISTNGSGGGVYVANGRLTDCVFENNSTSGTSSRYGGGAYATSSTIEGCQFTGNSAYSGGGMYVQATMVTDCWILGNTSSHDGGGIYANYSCNIMRCEIKNNSASYGGGAYSYNNWGTGNTFAHCTISHNNATYGGGVYGSYVNVRNCLVENNTAGSTGGGLSLNNTCSIVNTTIVRNTSTGDGAGVNGSSSTMLRNCIVWGNERNGAANNINGSSVNCSYTAVEGGYPGTEMTLLDVANQPLFVNPSLTAGASDSTTNVDWHLQQGSVCINRGDNSFVTDSLDSDGTARVKRDTVDMGCYESDYFSAPITVYDSIIYVTVTGAGTHSGNSWANATSSIEEAQALAQTYNAVVWVAAGTYYGDTTATNAFTMRDGVNVYGGFAGNEPANFDLSLRDFETNPTILDGQNTRRILYQPFDFSNRTVWDGFSIQHGHTIGDGAGAYIRANSVIRRCIFKNNNAQASGGGLCVSLHVQGASQSWVEQNIFSNNTAGNYGGGVYFTTEYSAQVSSFVTISSCFIANNTAQRNGGGVKRLGSGWCRIYNSTITRNRSGNSGGGANESILTNCIVWGNERNGVMDNLSACNCSYSAIEGGHEGDSIIVLNNINQPLFVNPSLTAGASDSTANVDWHLQQGSVCVNRGDNSFVTDSLDLDGSARIKRDTVDLGCYESDYYSGEVFNCTTIYSEIFDTVCDSYSWNGHSYVSSGDYTQTFTNSLGCDSVVTLHLTVNHSTTSDTIAEVCDHFAWYEYANLTWSGNYTHRFTNENGCDSIVTLHLTVHHSVNTHEYITICENELPYTYRDTVFEVGTPQLSTFNSQLLTQNGCDSIITLHLTVLPSTVGEFAAMTPTHNYPLSSYPIRFTWDAVENASDYDLYVWVAGEPQPQQPTASQIHGTLYSLATLPNRGTYQWMMKAYNACDTSESAARQFTLNVPPALAVNASNPVDFGEVPLNSTRSVYFQVTGTALDSVITYQITGTDASSFDIAPTGSWDSLNGGRMQLTFHPTVAQNEYIAQMTIQSDNLSETFTIKGYLSDYLTFTTYVDEDVYAMDSEIPVRGQVTNPLEEPVAGFDVEVYVKVLDYVRTFPATTDANGQFTITFTPQHSEAGYYTVGSRRAGSNSSAVHDEFNIPGMMLVSSDWIMWTTTIDQAQTGTIPVRNRSQIPLTNIQVTPLSLPNGCSVEFSPLNLAGMATGELQYTVTGSQLSTGSNYEEVRLNAVSDEGAAMSFSAWYYCIPQRADLDVTPTSFTATMTRGQSKVVDFKIYNNGTGPTGNIFVSLPDVPWMSVVGSDTLPSLAVHDSAYVSIRLSPDSTIDLVRYTGSLAINCERGEGVSVPYSITAISDSTGTLVVDVTDEYTWNTNGGHGPHLAGASVTVRGYYSLETVATGVTDANGLFEVSDLPEGYYKLTVRAERHEEFQGNLYITAGETNRQDIFIQFQAITYSWEVVPTEIEDEYTYELNVEYETHVPKPVVVLDMPENIPELEEGDSYTFDYILTNYGLVTTYDVQLFTPESSIYTFTPLIDHMDSLPAQSTQIIPCVMSRPAQTRSASMNRLRGSRSECPYLLITKVLSYYFCARGQIPEWAYTARNVIDELCNTIPNNIINTNNTPTFHDGPSSGSGSGSSSSSWISYIIPTITMPVVTCECQDEVTYDTTFIITHDGETLYESMGEYDFVEFCDSCDSNVVICTTIKNCVTLEITNHCDTLNYQDFSNEIGNNENENDNPENGEENNPTGALQVDLLWNSGESHINQLVGNRDYTVKGVVADGISTLKIRIKAAGNYVLENPTDAILFFNNIGNPNRGQSSEYMGTILSQTRISDQCVEVVYRAPSIIPWGISKEYTIVFACNVGLGDSIYTVTKPILIRRVPVLMVHGLSDNGNCFNDLYNLLLTKKSGEEKDRRTVWWYGDFITGLGDTWDYPPYDSWQLLKVDYEPTNLESFYTNINVIQTHIHKCLFLVAGNQFVASKVDIVGHSMGGILARLHVQEVDNTNVHKIITLNTPHSGSQGANAIMDNPIIGGIACLKFSKRFLHCDLDAVNDLQVGSFAMTQLLNNPLKLDRMNGIPIHSIATTCEINHSDILMNQNHWIINMAQFVKQLVVTEEEIGLNYFLNWLYSDYNDVVVSLGSQKGGLESPCTSVLGEGAGFASWHSGSPHFSPSLYRISELLRTPTSSLSFCTSGFRPDANLPIHSTWIRTSSNQTMRSGSGTIQPSYRDNTESSIQVMASYNDSTRQIVSLLNYSDGIDLYATMVHFEIDEDFLSLSDTSYFNVSPTYRGPVHIYAIGQTSDEEIVMDSTTIMINDYGTTPQSIEFVEDTLYLMAGETGSPTLWCAWANGDTTYVTPTYISDSSIVSVENGIIRGNRAGTTLLTAHFEDLAASIPVIVYGWDLGGDNNGGDNDTDSLTHNTVCASVTVQFSQNMTMTREAFEGTLTINNGHESQAMQDIDVDFVIKDENSVDCTNLFQINFLSYNNMTGTNGNASLDAQNTGSIVVQFIPTKQAAPTMPKQYSFGGSFSFIDPFTNESMTYNLYPVDIMVNPSPDLYVNYFMQRDILGDDPLTEDRIEPIIPAELGVIIHNRGAGTAKNVLLETAEPRIIDNEKGLAVDFAMYGAAFNGNERQLGLMEIPFGNIEPGRTGVGEWWFTSTLLGHFVSYEAHVIHNNSFGNPDLSLVSSLDIHPLIHAVYAYGNLDDGINDFLVDDVEDSRNYPDSLYFSNGSRTSVATADDISFDHYVTPLDTIVILTLDPSRIGWNYEQTWDPGRGQYKLISCTRNSDQQVIPLSNVWQSHVTIPVGADPIYENKLHIVDTLSNDLPTTYTLVFSLNAKILEVDTILNVPDTVITTPLAEVTVVFNKPIVDSTFNYLDMSLKCNNGENLLDGALEVERLDSMTYKLHLEPYTGQSGYYVLNIQTLNIMDLDGFNGYYAKQGTWIQNIITCQPDSISISAIACNSFDWYGNTYTSSGDYTHTLTNAAGCDSVVTLHLTVNNTTYGDTTAIACNSFNWYEQTGLTVSGDYTHTLTNAAGCDSVVTLHLTVNHSTYGDTTAIACNSFDWHEHAGITQSCENLTHTFTNANGCDSVVTLHLTVNYTTYGDTTVIACNSFDWYEQTGLTVSGDYTHTLTNAAGCDSIVTLHLTVNHTTYSDTIAIACDSYDWHGTTYTQSGNYTHTLTNAVGCDSVVTLHLTVNHTTYGDTTAIACNSFNWYGTTFTSSGNYTHTFTNVAGCDSVVTLHLIVNTSSSGDTTAIACGSFDWYEHTGLTESGDYTHTLTNANGCDSVVTLHLTVNHTTYGDTTAIACDSYDWYGTTYTQSGDYTHTLTNAAGCESVVTLHLTVNHTTYGDTTAIACNSFDWYGNTYTQSGDYTRTVTNAAGCDSIVTLHLTIYHGEYVEVSMDTCGTEYYWALADTSVSQSGTYYHYSTNANTCTDTTVLMLALYPSATTELTAQICEGEVYDLNGFNASTAGDHQLNLQTSHGCDSVVILHLTVGSEAVTQMAASICEGESYNENGFEITAPAAGVYEYSDTIGRPGTCDSIVVLTLTVNQPTVGDTTAVACGSFDWHGYTSLTESGDYTDVLTNAAGCDSTVTLHLTVYQPVTELVEVTACEGDLPYHYVNGDIDTTFDIGTQNLSVFNFQFSTQYGCDSIVTLHLTINHGEYVEVTVDTCGTEFFWAVSGQSYGHSDTYYYYSTNANACQDTTALILSLRQATVTELSAQICEGDIYSQHGFNVSEAGDHEQHLQTVFGCDSTVILHLAVDNETVTNIVASICEGEDYVDNGFEIIAPAVGISEYSDTIHRQGTCDSIVILTLMVNQATYGDTTVVACNSFDWYEQTGLTVSGDYTHTLTNAAGCDSIVTLHLTINQPTYGDTTAVACGSFDWHGYTNLTESGDYTEVLTNTAGCDSTVTLHLTINVPTEGDTTAVACGSFNWHGYANLTESGDYTDVLTNAVGCDSTVTLHLTINMPTEATPLPWLAAASTGMGTPTSPKAATTPTC